MSITNHWMRPELFFVSDWDLTMWNEIGELSRHSAEGKCTGSCGNGEREHSHLPGCREKEPSSLLFCKSVWRLKNNTEGASGAGKKNKKRKKILNPH